MSSVFYDREQIAEWLGAGIAADAGRYAGAVTNLRWEDGSTLSGDVQGASPEPYRVRVAFTGNDDNADHDNAPPVDGRCTCPAGHNCEHVAALLFATLGDTRATTASERVGPMQSSSSTLARFRAASPAALKPAIDARPSPSGDATASADSGSTTAAGENDAAAPADAHDPNALAYVIAWSALAHRHEVRVYRARRGADGAIVSIDEPFTGIEAALVRAPRFVSDGDTGVLRGLWLGRQKEDRGSSFALRDANGADMLHKLLATGRLFAALPGSAEVPPRPLAAGGERNGYIGWEHDLLTASNAERLRPALHTEPAATLILPTEPVWYIDSRGAQAGLVRATLPFQKLPDYLSMPPISLADAPFADAARWDTDTAEADDVDALLAPVPAPSEPASSAQAPRIVDGEPTPVLVLTSVPLAPGAAPRPAPVPAASNDKPSKSNSKAAAAQKAPDALDFATIRFDYGGISLRPESAVTIVPLPDALVHIRRRYESEKQRLLELRKTGLQKIPSQRVAGLDGLPDIMLGLAETDAWNGFVNDTLPKLAAQGWRIEMSPAFRYNVIEIDAIDGVAHHAPDGWFDLEMGIAVGGREVRLEPLLADLFRRDRRWLSGALDSIPDDEPIDLKTEDNKRLRLRADRLKPVVRVLVDLFDGLGEKLANAHGERALRVSALDAGRLDALNSTGRWQFHGESSIRELAERLQAGPGLREVPVPQGLQASLRPYQQQGLNWMQYLREQHLAGVLADDMGLGKTVQTLAHVLAEKEAGRLDKPVLIVVPTTLVHNWRDEARRFAPSLSVLVLNGPQRKERFEQIPTHDLVLTTYALLWRDQKVLTGHEYHLLILDEAQYVKNATTKAALAIRGLHARHRLCLTGTPLENHLGELWAQFDFLLPGFLGNQRDFTRRWRNPIEKNNDSVRRALLARRIRPFMLRRRKDEVAKELPAKTTILCSVDLEGAQRELYETVRAAMQEKVRAAVDAQGFARSHIIVLDALLKLRQVCCDPRLVHMHAAVPGLQAALKSAAPGTSSDEPAATTVPSAKLDLLLSMLPELIEEGRRVLLFSQFTGMLELIGAALKDAGIPYVQLTGDTADRALPVERFQRGDVPLFLISLKAGGVGLNLTAADTVIHYDPWWNPAAENQATDRAHRIGQDKPVFVYKLIAAGSIEEKIVELQEEKAGLADSILSEDLASTVKFSDDDLDALFAPIPGLDGIG